MEEGQRLKTMIEKKKFEIPIPEITTVADLRGEESKLGEVEQSMSKLEFSAGRKANEESTSSHKDSANSAKHSPLKVEAAKGAAAPPVPAFNGNPCAIYKYKPFFKLPQYYVK